ncbi:hypothetical protein SAMN05216251_12716 [Actinacidiphila alni]|uniref:DUF6884 domain-containing protein n=1 Tax=Actinacidiphila alni TaxID=380248 RepID=A0A1I2L827_9ACTN|nr:DUF6884 domain-containing protein [Actinacidiphila alni]SFF74650.1 hypothetical protein SAMN05216251_12716 [Actinacidiphila alni]
MTIDEDTTRPRRRPLRDVAGGPVQQAHRVDRCRSHMVASPLLLDDGQAVSRLSFPVQGEAARSLARAEAACVLAPRFGVRAQRLPSTRWSAVQVVVEGDPAPVARCVAAMPRILDYVEVLASEAARAFGRWSRHSCEAALVTALGAVELHTRAREFRAAAFDVAARVLAGPYTDSCVAARTELPPWDQVEAIAGGYASYGWVDVADAYDPAEVQQLLAHAIPATGYGALDHRTASHDTAGFEQLALPIPDSGHLRSSGTTVVVIPCSGAKLDRRATAGEIYTGRLHGQARRAADALTAGGGTVLVLSALHGFLSLTREIEPYEHRWNQPGSVTAVELLAQAAALGLADADDVILLTPSAYTARAARVWPEARAPLAHMGIGRQLARLASLREHSGSVFCVEGGGVFDAAPQTQRWPCGRQPSSGPADTWAGPPFTEPTTIPVSQSPTPSAETPGPTSTPDLGGRPGGGWWFGIAAGPCVQPPWPSTNQTGRHHRSDASAE